MPSPISPQVIPRPPDWAPGGPAPWDALPAAARRGIGMPRVLDALDRVDQAGAAPDGLGLHHVLHARGVAALVERAAVERINSGVLVALFEEGGEARLVLTRRSAGLRQHTGQVSFPGGRVDEGETPTEAAVREAHEEIGLDPALVSTVGWLHPVLAPGSMSLIMPVVATLPERPELVPNPAEVARVFDASLSELAQPEIFHEEHWIIPEGSGRDPSEGPLQVWFFEVAGETIWGATARMIYELLRVVLTVD